MIVIINYGVGNLGSILNMVRKVGVNALISQCIEDIERAEKLILPGVGSFDAGIVALRQLGYYDLLNDMVLRRKTPILGICLGMQLLTNRSEEGQESGFGWIDAETMRFALNSSRDGLKVPNMGWNSLDVRQHTNLFSDNEEHQFYFVHSYHVMCNEPANILATTFYGYRFPSAVIKGNIVGVQFHPEKSHRFGVEFLRRFCHEFSTQPKQDSTMPADVRDLSYCTEAETESNVPGGQLRKRTRVIPALLLKGAGLVKTKIFKDPVYLGDPMNIAKIFNDKEVDELVLLDIDASIENRGPSFSLLERIAASCFMPLGYGGGIRTVQDIQKLFSVGFEKAIINSYAVEKPSFIREAVRIFGSQSIVISIDVRKSRAGQYEVYTHSGQKGTKLNPVEFAQQVEEMGAGEILLTSIDRDGTMQGYDVELIRMVSRSVNIPVIASGGAGKVEDFASAARYAGAAAVAAGSMFVFHGPHRAVLINVPAREKLEQVLR